MTDYGKIEQEALTVGQKVWAFISSQSTTTIVAFVLGLIAGSWFL